MQRLKATLVLVPKILRALSLQEHRVHARWLFDIRASTVAQTVRTDHDLRFDNEKTGLRRQQKAGTQPVAIAGHNQDEASRENCFLQAQKIPDA